MMPRAFPILALAGSFFIVSSVESPAEPPLRVPPRLAPARLGAVGVDIPAPTEDDKKMLADVAGKLVAVCERPQGVEWPPDFGYENSNEINAHATYVVKDGKEYPLVRVWRGMLARVIKGEDDGCQKDRMASILGHELGHILKKHPLKHPFDKPLLVQETFTRTQELEADSIGAELVLKAGYSLQKGLLDPRSGAVPRMQALGLEYSSFEGLGKNHPSWNDRAARIDKEKPNLWKSMAAYNNGVIYLAMEDFPTAGLAFEKVVAEFPNTYEAWANLGYAQLMRYLDDWRPEDVKEQGVGQIAMGGFYTRGPKLRGKDDKRWLKAVDSLREANRLKPGQTIVLANLGVAHLFHPAGKAAGIGEAARFFAEAVEAAKTDKDLDPVAHAAVLVNLGVSTIASGDAEKGLAQLEASEKFAGVQLPASSINAARTFSRASTFAARNEQSNKEAALKLWVKYLRNADPRALWWSEAYDRYKQVCKEVGREAQSRESFKRDRVVPVRPVSSVAFKNGTIRLLDETTDVVKAFGPGRRSLAIQGLTIQRVRYEEMGVELLVSDDQVVAIILASETSPPIPLTGKVVGTGRAGELKIGMDVQELDGLLDSLLYEKIDLIKTRHSYRYYREAGVAVKVSESSGRVTELVVVQAPQPQSDNR